MEKLKKIIDIFKLEISEIQSVPESFSSEVHSLILKNGEKVILKIPYNKEKLVREFKMLELLKDKLPVPKVLNYWEGNDETAGALLLSYINGKPLTGEIDKKTAYHMGEILAKLHEIPMEYFELTDEKESDWWKNTESRFQIWIKECEEVMSEEMLSKSINLFQIMYKSLPAPDGPCVVHFDYRPGNILVNETGIVGLIDFESSRGGSADIDFTKPKLYVWDRYPGTREEFIKGYESIRPMPEVEKTLPFYLFYNAFGGIAWCVRRGQCEGDFYEENMEQLKGVLEDYQKEV